MPTGIILISKATTERSFFLFLTFKNIEITYSLIKIIGVYL